MSVGRIFGVEVQIHWTWLILFAFLSLSLAAGVFPAWHPGWSAGLNWTVAIAACLLFFASILVHELAHSLVARARDLPVRRIQLFMFGGVSNIERDPPSAGDEFLITIVGPLTSFVLGIACVYAGGALAGDRFRTMPAPAAVAGLSPLATLLLWLGPVNLLLAAFNLVPGFPLDGGRILRSAIWAGTRDLRLATRWAVGVGRVVAILFVVIGAAMIFGFHVPPFGAGPMNGLWLVLIGWFLHDAAVASYGRLELKQALQDVPVARLMRREVPRVSPELSVSDLVEHWLLQSEQRAFPVMEGEHLAGLVTLEDVRKVPREEWNDRRVGDVMTPERDLEVVEEQAAAGEALKLMRRNVEQLPVLANGHLEGIVRRADILRWVELRSGFAH